MRAPLHAFLLLLLTAGGLAAQNATTALSAVRMLPRAAAQSLARIEAREGGPTPARWYLLVHDPQTENGLREFVVAGGEVETSRTLSQFAESLQPEDVLSVEELRYDSEQAAAVAERYAQANGEFAATMNYALRKGDAPGAAQWTVTCFNLKGRKLGRVVLSAREGTVISHEGFALDPAASARPAKLEPIEQETPEASRAERRRLLRERERLHAQQRQPVVRPQVVVRGTPAPQPNALGKIGNSIQRLFGGQPQPPAPPPANR